MSPPNESNLDPQERQTVQVEARLTNVEIKTETIKTEIAHLTTNQIRHQEILDQQHSLITALSQQQIATEAATTAIRDRTDLHSQNIEVLQAQEVDMSKVLEALKARVNLIFAIGGTIGGLLLNYLLTHFVH